jgi:transposase
MPAPYSYDLRQRVIAHYETQGCATHTSKVFRISRCIIYDWLQRKKESGDVKANTNYQRGHSHKIVDMAKFKECVEANSGATLSELVEKSGIDMSLMTCSRALNKLGITRKKRLIGIKNKTKRNAKYF